VVSIKVTDKATAADTEVEVLRDTAADTGSRWLRFPSILAAVEWAADMAGVTVLAMVLALAMAVVTVMVPLVACTVVAMEVMARWVAGIRSEMRTLLGRDSHRRK